MKRKYILLSSLFAVQSLKAGCCGPVVVKESTSQLSNAKDTKYGAIEYAKLNESKLKELETIFKSGKANLIGEENSIYVGAALESLEGFETVKFLHSDEKFEIQFKGEGKQTFSILFKNPSEAFTSSCENWQQERNDNVLVIPMTGSVCSATDSSILGAFKKILGIDKNSKKINFKELAKETNLKEEEVRKRVRLGQIPMVQFHTWTDEKVEKFDDLMKQKIFGLDLFMTEFEYVEEGQKKFYSKRFQVIFKSIAEENNKFKITSIAESLCISSVDNHEMRDRILKRNNLTKKAADYLDLIKTSSKMIYNAKMDDHGTSFLCPAED